MVGQTQLDVQDLISGYQRKCAELTSQVITLEAVVNKLQAELQRQETISEPKTAEAAWAQAKESAKGVVA